MNYYHKMINTSLGRLTLVADETHLVEVRWKKGSRPVYQETTEKKSHPVLLKTEKQLLEYFKGERKKFELPIRLTGTTFQKSVWRQLQKISFGSTRTYQDLATRLGNPLACRAVGAANGKNPLSIIIPCHRVIGSNGDLTGFSGGIKTKAFLLSQESQK